MRISAAKRRVMREAEVAGATAAPSLYADACEARNNSSKVETVTTLPSGVIVSPGSLVRCQVKYASVPIAVPSNSTAAMMSAMIMPFRFMVSSFPGFSIHVVIAE